MEFYTTAFGIKGIWDGFNSQWDRILLYAQHKAEIAKKVSIPNGMEFYISSSSL